MDISQEYVDMCKAAEEIQKLFKPKEGDFILDGVNQKHYILDKAMLIVYERHPQYKADDIWLPRQDQLQEIVVETTSFNKLIDCTRFCHANYEGLAIGSLEQVWLQYVMYKLHNKKWNVDKKQFIVANG